MQKFFEERSDQSEVKARIVEKYFSAWASIILPTVQRRNLKIGYVDLYAGPGRYRDGAASTPLLVLEKAISNPKIAERLLAVFNDKDNNNSNSLKEHIAALPNVSSLKNAPVITCGEIDNKAEEHFSKTKLFPTFTFFDPFGYKGLSLGIIEAVIKDWGCDCVFFFNYNRINAGLSNLAVNEHINALFGIERANQMRIKSASLSPAKREALVLEEIAQALKGLGGKYVLPFRFKNAAGTRTSHSLIFVSKHFRGYSTMKDIMAKESSTFDQGVPSLDYCPAEADMPLLFSLNQPVNALRDRLLGNLAGRKMNVAQIYEEQSVDTRYVLRNFKDVLSSLFQEKKISVICTKGDGKWRKDTFPDHLIVEFPER